MGSWAGTTKADFKVGVFPLPSRSGDVVQGLNYGQALGVSATTKYPTRLRPSQSLARPEKAPTSLN